MTGRSRLLCALALAVVLTAGWSCTRADNSLPLGASDSVEAVPLPLAGVSEFGPDDGNALGAFPAFMPPVAIGSDTQECQLGTDPYSTCI